MSKNIDEMVSLWRQYGKMQVSEVAKTLKELSGSSGRRVVGQTMRMLRKSHLAADDEVRIGAVKVMIASLPKTLSEIELLRRDFSGALAYEVQFTLFCFLDDLLYPTKYFKVSKATLKAILAMLESYLMNVPRETASAAWMAGDLLGDHWRTKEAINILCRAAVRAKHSAGRKGAIHGLDHALGWLPLSGRKRVRTVLRTLAKSDSSASVRQESGMVLEGRGCSCVRHATTRRTGRIRKIREYAAS